MKNVNEYQLNDTDLIIALTESGVLNQGKLIKYFKEANDWQLEFVREFLNTHPELIDSWTEFREEFISILKQLESKENNFLEKKKLVFSVIIDLNWTKMAEYCVENFIHLDNEKLRRMALFISIRFGNDEIWKNLRQYMDKDEEIKEYVTKFWKQLERRDWNFYY
jgi:CRISPR/Cas system-associated endonuclease Cas3-HD